MRSGLPVLLGSRQAWLDRFPDVPPRSEFEAFAAVPLTGERGAIGCMGLGFADRRAFDTGDLELLQVIAGQGAAALERAALYEHRAHVARTLQSGLLPSELPEIAGLDVASDYRPLGAGDQVGGDFYDVFATEDGWTAAIGDVCGKGVEAAVVTGMVRHTLRALELGHGEPAAVLRRLNQAVRRHAPDDRYCSVALAHLTALQRGFRVDLACAGHPPPLVVRAGGTVEDLEACGTLLGIEDDIHLSPVSSELLPGDALVLYTDGITEARVRGELFGLDRLRAKLAELAGAPAAEITAGIQRAVQAFAPGHAADDQALLVLRVR
jgi:serine phosphatase RsbU (regulator of sigma subunit)